MGKRLIPAFIFLLSLAAVTGYAEEEVNYVEIKGSVREIGGSGEYIIVDGQKIITNQDFIDSAYLRVGDEVNIIAEKEGTVLRAVDYEFGYEGTVTDESPDAGGNGAQLSDTEEDPWDTDNLSPDVDSWDDME